MRKFFRVFSIVLFINNFGIITNQEELNASETMISDYGYVNVRPYAHMFWLLYRSFAVEEGKPLIIWLQGGPGDSATGYGNFEEIGPLDANRQPRNHTWVKHYNVLFIDGPIGTGFSYFEENANNTDNIQVAEDLMACIKEFLIKNPEFRATPTYLIGESYGGKIAVQFADLWHQEQSRKNIVSNLKGIAMIGALISPQDVFESRIPYLSNLGLFDTINSIKLNELLGKLLNKIDNSNWEKAYAAALEFENKMHELIPWVDQNLITSKVNFNHNFTFYSAELRVMMQDIKNLLKLQSDWGTQEWSVKVNFKREVMKPVIYQVERLLSNTDLRVFVLNGQFDLRVPTASTLKWIEKMNWSMSKSWYNSPRTPFVIDEVVEGYFKGFQNFKFYLVFRAGHMIPIQNPKAMEYILRDLIDDRL